MTTKELTFDEKFTNTYKQLFGIFKSIGLRRFKCQAIAEDLAQNAFFCAYPSLKRDSTEANMRTYITTVFRNSLKRLYHKHLRSQAHGIPSDLALYKEHNYTSKNCKCKIGEGLDLNSIINMDFTDADAQVPFELIEFETVLEDLYTKVKHPIAKKIIENIVDMSNLPVEAVNGSTRRILIEIEKYIGIPYKSAATWYIPRYILPCIEGYEFNKGESQ